MTNDHDLLSELRLKRLQRAVEYLLLTAMHIFFLLAFRGLYLWWMALLLGVITFGMNFQLTQLRERRRTASAGNRQRIMADTFESILFLVFIVAISAGSMLEEWLGIGDHEYLAYSAALLGGLFLSGLIGEIYWQIRYFRMLDAEKRQNYVTNLKRTIILPYTISRISRRR